MAPRPDAPNSALALSPSHPPGRQKITFTYRCGDAGDHEPPNPTDNPSFRSVVEQVLSRGRVKLFATMPIGAEATGPVIEDRFVLIPAQHPGDVDGATADAPASHWPDGGTSRPRPSVAAIYRDPWGRIGR